MLNIKQQFLPSNQYLTGSRFNSICIHHTAGGSAQSTINWWIQDKQRIATNYIIDRDGTIIQVIPDNCWAYHLYVASRGNKIDFKYKRFKHDVHSLGIELCNWGQLTFKDGKYLNYVGREVKDVIQCPHRGYTYWEPYTQAQIDSLENLLFKLVDEFNIPLKENYNDIFNINLDALNLKPGIYTHVSYRTDKVDCYSHPNLVAMLNNLTKNLNPLT